MRHATQSPAQTLAAHPPGAHALAPATATPTARPARPAVALNQTTSVTPRPERGGYAIQHQNPDGSRMVVNQHRLAGGTTHVGGYKQVVDPRSGTTTRTYADGHRTIAGPDYRSRSIYGGPTYTTYRSGLHSAVLPGGRPLYREGYAVYRGQRVVERTVYARVAYGHPVYYAAPVVRVYNVVPLYGAPVYVYRPYVYEPVFYRIFWSPFVTPVVVTRDCYICPARVVVFASPVVSYTNSVDLLGDLQISSAFDERVAVASAAEQQADHDELAQLRQQMSGLQQQVGDTVGSNEQLKTQLAAQGTKLADIKAESDALKAQQTVSELSPVQVPEEVRQQVRQQMRLSIAQHRNGRSIAVSDIASSGYAKIYLFQAAAPINVTDKETGDECFLNSGDLIRFSSPPNGDSAVAQMAVVTSGADSCKPRQVVEVPMADLQEMLNGFNERVEGNMKRVNSCVGASAKCQNT